MNSGGPWWMGRYDAGGAKNKTIIDNLMLRFRPIAPKPPGGDSFSNGPMAESRSGVVARRKVKRKYVRVSKNNSRCKRENAAVGGDRAGVCPNGNVVTLQLLPDKSDLPSEPLISPGSSREIGCAGTITEAKKLLEEVDESEPRMWRKTIMDSGLEVRVSNETAPSGAVMETRVTVESVEESTCIEITEQKGCTDIERMKDLIGETCPCFVTDVFDRVVWVNRAYVGLLKVGEMETPTEELEIIAVLVVKERESLPWWRGGFACRVRLECVWPDGRQWRRVVPCDAWRMEGGGFAWRLDVKAALSLSVGI